MNNIEQILDEKKSLVWKEIQKYLKDPVYPKSFKIPARYKKDTDAYWKIVKEYPERQGKYLRPTLLLLTYEAMGKDQRHALNTAAAMQLSEDWLLIHDDLQDHSLMRRKKPTLHRMYGEELAINAGDSLQIIMWKILTDNILILGKKRAHLILNEFFRMLKRTADGQAVEMMWAKSKKMEFKDEDWFFIADGKTAYYTIAGPMRLGAILAGADRKQLESLTRFGLYLGRCFQLVDDLLDIEIDIYEGKRTLILSHLIRNAKSHDRKRILSIIAKTQQVKTEKEVAWIITKMYEYKSIDYARKIAKELKDKAYKIFKKELTFLSHQPVRGDLETLINFVLERQY